MTAVAIAPATPLGQIWRDAVASPTAQRVRPHVEYQREPVRWMVHQLGIPERTIRWSLNPGYGRHRWDGTPDPLVAALEAIAEWINVGVEAGTGTGKTYVLGAGATLWFLASFENAIVITGAPKEDQLKLNLWKEIRALWPRFQRLFPSATLTDGKIRMRGGLDETWAATAFVAGVGAEEESANKARGFHAQHALFITEETPGMHAAVLTAFDNTCTAPHNLQLRLGNPDNEQDELHKFCSRAGVTRVRISSLDHPNVVSRDPEIIPGAVSQRSIDARRADYGEGSSLFNAMVRGIAPKEASDALIRWSWCEEAAKRYSDSAYRVGLPSIGCDVADSPRGDQAAIARGLGACLVELSAFHIGEHGINDASELGADLALEIGLEGVDERHVGVDAVGVGASTVNKCRELRVHVVAINGGASPQPRLDEDMLREKGKGLVPVELFDNLNSQMHWLMRQDLQHGRIGLPDDAELFRDLTSRKWLRRNGKICIESKEEARKRLGRSPNKGDAAVYWNWVRPRSKLPAPEPERRGAFHPKTLAHEARESRRVKPTRSPLPRRIPVTAIESLD